ncbi:hypothetical protein FB45DRAFT_1023091 [Roridomyces roridus]|uniref:F-box domain-containing protein n=1 Tax=Roridomyces roridus TaxID=1738132 RepID=A0AAD7C3M4_9AGAR|nr:hypothetical protein FB45DRAFT_1023091 [Roridomyces roridus]
MQPPQSCPQCGSAVPPFPPKDTRPASIRARLFQLDSLIAQLAAERNTLQAKCDKIVYPVLSLPAEVTSEIFSHCVEPLSDPSPSTAPLLLTRICRQWREIALASPPLWRSLTLLQGTPQEWVEMCLSQAKNLPLEYRLSCDWGDSEVDALLEPILLRYRQWQDMEMEIPLSFFPRFNLGDNAVPLLRRIVFAHSPVDEQEVPSGIVVLRNAPLLQEVGIRTWKLSFQLPWHQLTTFTTAAIAFTPAECLAILAGCSMLRHLKFDCPDTGNEHEHAALSPLTLPHLESFGGVISHLCLLDYLTLPSLLRLSVEGAVNPDSVTKLVDLAHRSRFPLRELTLSVQDITLDGFRALVLVLPESVNHLAITFYWPATMLFAPILTVLEAADVLPCLSRLILRVMHQPSFDGGGYQAVVDLLRARMRPSGPRLSVQVLLLNCDTLPAVPIKVITQLRSLASEGMEIRLELETSEATKSTMSVL